MSRLMIEEPINKFVMNIEEKLPCVKRIILYKTQENEISFWIIHMNSIEIHLI